MKEKIGQSERNYLLIYPEFTYFFFSCQSWDITWATPFISLVREKALNVLPLPSWKGASQVSQW